jgi:hypothetical protein
VADELLASLVVGSGLFATVLGFFWRLEEIVSPEAKRAISAWLKRLEVSPSLATWPDQFATLFDRLFGEKHLSWRCFRRSCMASLATAAATSLAWAILRPDEFAVTLASADASASTLIGLLLMYSLLPDYLSLLKTRYVIKSIAAKKSQMAVVLLLIADAAASVIILIILVWSSFVLIFILVFVPRVVYLYLIGDLITLTQWVIPYFGRVVGLYTNFSRYIVIYGPMLLSPPGTSFSPGVFLYATLFTSIWAWLYALAGGAVRLAARARPGLSFLKWLLDIDGHPLRSIGVIAGALSCLVCWLFAFLMAL